MRPTLIVLAPFASVLLSSACAPAVPATTAQGAERPASLHLATERRCFTERQIRNFTANGTGVLYLKVWGPGDGTYQLTTGASCRDLDTAHQLSVTPQLGSGRLCTGDWATVAAPGLTGAPQVCRALIEKQLTEAEIEALPGRDRP